MNFERVLLGIVVGLAVAIAWAGVKLSWDTGPNAKPILDPKFVDYVEAVLAE